MIEEANDGARLGRSDGDTGQTDYLHSP